MTGESDMEHRNTQQKMIAASSWLDAKWYALFVRSNQEKRVAQHLKIRAVEHFLPVYESVRQWQDRKIKLLSPLFPGYVFIKLPFVERLKVLVVPNVVNIVGTSNMPSVIPDEEIEYIRRGMEGGNVQPHPYIKVGSRVRIKAGAMAGMQGILVRVQNCIRVLVALDSISRAFTVAVDNDWLEPVAAQAGVVPVHGKYGSSIQAERLQ